MNIKHKQIIWVNRDELDNNEWVKRKFSHYVDGKVATFIGNPGINVNRLRWFRSHWTAHSTVKP